MTRSTTVPSRAGFEDEYPFASHFAEIDGHRYHYVDEGPRDADETLLMVHGNPTWSFAWRNVVRAFAGEHRCIAVDHIGCGFSDKPADYPYVLDRHVANLVAFCASLDLVNVTLIGHDWGGCIAMGAATRIPDRFRRFVLCNTAAFRSIRIPFRIAVCRWPLLGPLGVRGLNLFAGMALRMAVEQPLTPAVRAGYLAPYDSWANRVAVQCFVEDIPLSPKHPSWDTLVAIENGLEGLRSKPMLLVWGERDWCFTPAFRAEFEQRFPEATSVPIANAGHYVFEDATEELVAAIRTHIAGTTDPESSS